MNEPFSTRDWAENHHLLSNFIDRLLTGLAYGLRRRRNAARPGRDPRAIPHL